MNQHLQRARMLRDHRRYDEALAAIYQHLAGHPDSFDGHFELAATRLAQGTDRQAALRDIDRAISLGPGVAYAHAMKSIILHALDCDKEALASADEARRIDPELSLAWFCRGSALLALRSLPDAEEAARRSLELDPDDSDASNLLATILRLQRRFGEAEVEIERHLARAPENAWTFATAGWTALNQGHRAKAEELFREALRLDPELEHARIGLREAFKARSAFYRLFLRWAFFMQRFSTKSQWVIILAIYLGYRFGRALLDSLHPLAAVPLVIVYLLFCFGGFLASGLGHFLLLKDPLARLSLDDMEKRDGLLVGGLFFGGLLILVACLIAQSHGGILFGGSMMGAAVPASLVCGNPSRKGRLVFGLIAAVVMGCGTAMWISSDGGTLDGNWVGDEAAPYLLVAALCVALTTWISGISWLREEMPR
jgi:tetratricopeptide (TPR) repeat protein